MRGRWLAAWWLLLAATTAGAQAVDWQVREVMRFAEADPDIAFARITDMAVDDAGRFYVLDALNSEIYVFDAEGRHVRTIGRRGAGPGELSDGAGHLAVAGDHLLVHDIGNQRLTVFALDGRLEGSFRVALMEGRVESLEGLPDGTMLLQRNPPTLPPGVPRAPRAPERPLLLRLDTGGTVLDTVFRFEPFTLVEFVGGGMRNHFPDRLPAWTVGAAGRVVIGATDRYQLRWWQDGRLSAPWGRDLRRDPVTASFRARVRTLQDSMAAAAPGGSRMQMEFVFPDSLPAFSSLHPGPFGTVLVRRLPDIEDTWPRPGPFRADVFDDGRFVGEWQAPARFLLFAARGDRLYGITRDEDDVDYVVIYRVER